MAICSVFSRNLQSPLSFIIFIFGLVIDIFDIFSVPQQQFELDLTYHRRTRSDSGQLTTPNLSSSFSAADMTKRILPIMKLEEVPTNFDCTDHACAICLSNKSNIFFLIVRRTTSPVAIPFSERRITIMACLVGRNGISFLGI
ncbi:hypothetical protein MKX01_034987 [Papaver californicum]|nr:hypothetical protein MKX01_034987 [Papaver californicum]